ncbi:unnamed protein product [Arctogadus glacialis]
MTVERASDDSQPAPRETLISTAPRKCTTKKKKKEKHRARGSHLGSPQLTSHSPDPPAPHALLHRVSPQKDPKGLRAHSWSWSAPRNHRIPPSFEPGTRSPPRRGGHRSRRQAPCFPKTGERMEEKAEERSGTAVRNGRAGGITQWRSDGGGENGESERVKKSNGVFRLVRQRFSVMRSSDAEIKAQRALRC